MNKKKTEDRDPADPRRRAEEMISVDKAGTNESLSPEEGVHLIHELQVRQIEMQMKNEELSRAHEQLEAERARYFDLYDFAPVGYFTLSEKGVILEANLTAATLLGMARGALVKQSITRFVLPEDQDVYSRHRKELFETGEPQACELRMVKKDGASFWAGLEATAAQDPGGAPTSLVVMRNITERKRAEEEKADLETQLRQTQRMEAIGTLAGGIAHDFNNILAIIMGNAEIGAAEIPETNRARRSFDEITKASYRARDLVKQILAFSRQTEQERKPVRVGSIVKEVLKFLRASLPTTIRIEQGIAVDRDTVLADPTQIHQVLMNLCTNAHQALLEQGGLLAVTLKNVEIDSGIAAEHPDLQPGSYLTLTVSDTGDGMTWGVTERIFDPYFTTKGKGEGTGLGLAVVHGIVKSHGGAILVKSEPGKGSAFEVFLPLIEDEKETSEARTYGDIPKGNERVLFVDDEEAIADLGKRVLQHLGYEVEVRTSSIEALEAFKAQPDKFDLVITDMTMPNMTGDRLARKLMGIRPGIPVILCTGYSERMTSGKAKELGIRGYVMKPMVMREIASAIRQALEKG